MNQRLAARLSIAALAAALCLPAAAVAQVPAGFYGGVVRTDPSVAPTGVVLGDRQPFGLTDAGLPSLAVGASDSRVFGGYRWRNQLALEAAFARSESYALKPFGTGAPGGVGLDLATRAQATPLSSLNVDVVGSYTLRPAFALYGRVGYALPETNGYAPSLAAPDARTTVARDGVNYGLGLRYDFTQALGLNLEYTRFGRYGWESFNGALPEGDQVRLGLRFRF